MKDCLPDHYPDRVIVFSALMQNAVSVFYNKEGTKNRIKSDNAIIAQMWNWYTINFSSIEATLCTWFRSQYLQKAEELLED